MYKNLQNLYQFSIVDASGAGRAGLSPTVKISKDGGALANASGTVTALDATNAPGVYKITFTATECNCDALTIVVTLPNGINPALLEVHEMTRPVDLTSVKSLIDHWTLDNNTITVYDEEGNVLETCTIAKDATGAITSVTPTAN